MGQSQSGQLLMAQGLGIYIQTNNDIYIAGQYLQGSVYLKSNKDIKIKSLIIRFTCKQSVSIIEKNSQQTTSYNINGTPYQETIKINTFNQKQTFNGSFIFPFKILLSSQLSGSINQNQSNFLKYILSAQLHTYQSNQVIYSNQFIVHITQPFRLDKHQINQTRTNYPQCCNCCQSYGTVYVKLYCDKNVVRAGQAITVNAQIDNQHGRIPVQNASLSLIKHVHQVSPQGQRLSTIQNQLTLQRFSSRIMNGSKDDISITKTIPIPYSSQSSAFGSIIAIYYTLSIKSHMGICSDGANMSVPIHFIAKDSQIDKNKRLKSSSFNTSKSYPLFTYTNMKSYQFQPVQGIPCLNRKYLNSKRNLSEMNQVYVGVEGKRDAVYEIKKTIVQQHRSRYGSNTMQRQPTYNEGVGPDVPAVDPKTYNEKENKEARQKKYMDQQDQNDYNEFKDFKQNKVNSTNRLNRTLNW